MSRGDLRKSYELCICKMGLVLAAVCLSALASFAPSAQAAEQHLFSPELSLTGTCSTDAGDPVRDPWCPGPPGPSAPFENPSITVDSFGYMYVSSHKGDNGEPSDRVDVFNPEGEFVTEILVKGAKSLAVDAEGNLYVFQFGLGGFAQVSRFSPTTYEPAAGEIEYEDPGEIVVPAEFAGWCGNPNPDILSPFTGVAVDPATGRLFVSRGNCVGEFSSASAPEPNQALDLTIGTGVLTSWSSFIAVDTTRDRLFVVDAKEEVTKGTVEVFELNAPHVHLGRLNGAATPQGKFLSGTGEMSVDVNEANGHVFVSDIKGSSKVYEMGSGLGAEEEHLNTFERSFKYVSPGEIAVDNSGISAGVEANQGTFYVPSRSTEGALNHTYAFVLTELRPPLVESISATEVTASEAVLRATINPGGDATTYRFEYVTQQSFEENSGFSGASSAGGGVIPAGIEGVDVSVPASGLMSGTAYRFRVIAENSIASDTAEGGFRTYLDLLTSGLCSNEVLRTGLSADLPDCRAYELVSPAEANGRTPLAGGSFGVYFPMLVASPGGDRASFRLQGGSLPGEEGAGSFNGENYLSRRGSEGWATQLAGPSGTDAVAPLPGGVSPDQEHSFWSGELPGEQTLFAHVRYPDGHSAPVGRGSLGTDPRVIARLISEDGAHVIFSTSNAAAEDSIQLEPNAPPDGTTAVYDRTSNEITHVVSLLPGDITPAPGQDAAYVGASYDGEGVAFSIGGTLYLRRDNQTTYEVGNGVTFAGVAEGGGRIFYLQGGNLFALDTATGDRIAFSKGGDATPVNVSADGSTAYFVSPDVLVAKQNPQGATAQGGKENLYVSRGGDIGFVGTVTSLDVTSKPLYNGEVVGLGQWVKALETGTPGRDTSRTNSNGSVLLFESQANLTAYDSDGRVQVYRYDARVPSLSCLSCNPTEAAATSDASLQSIQREPSGLGAIVDTTVRIPNVRPDGKRAFFQSFEALVPTDVDNRQDVYEWEASGVGSCNQAEGCIYLISSGQSARDEHLFGHSASGDDVFFFSSEILLGADLDQTPSIYDARVGGGFSQSPSNPCQGEGCRGILTPAPALSPPVSSVGGDGNVSGRACPKGKRKVVRGGKVRCIVRACPKGKRKVVRGGKARCVKKKGSQRQKNRRGGTKRGPGK